MLRKILIGFLLIILVVDIIFLFHLYSIETNNSYNICSDNSTSNNTFILNKETMDLLNYKFSTEDNEFVYCFKVNISNNNYYAYDVYEPKVYETSPSRIRHKTCKKNEGMIHSHPNGFSCLSRKDIENFDTELLSGIIYDQNKIAIFLRNDTINTLNIIIN